MNLLILDFIIMLILTTVLCVSIKISARLLRYQGIRLTFGFIIVVATLLASFLNLPKHAVFIVLPIYLLFGGWFFRKRGTKRSGEILGWCGSVLLAGIAIIPVGITIIALFNTFHR